MRADRIVAIGGITNSRECMDVISQLLKLPIRVINGQSAGAVGSCLLAGVAMNFFESEDAAFDTMYAAQSENVKPSTGA